MIEENEDQEVVFDDDPGEMSPARLMALWQRGKIPKERLDRKMRSKIMAELSKRRKTFGAGTGRPRTVPHEPGPRGGCRCAECRGKRK